MKRVFFLAFVAFGLNSAGASGAADGPLVLDVWPGRAVGDHGTDRSGARAGRGRGTDQRREVDHERHATDDLRVPSGRSEQGRESRS